MDRLELLPIEKMEYKDSQVAIDDVSIDYVQSSDCTEEEGAQVITISTRNNGVARFLNIKTGEEGWSFCDIDELAKLINDFKQRSMYTEEEK